MRPRPRPATVRARRTERIRARNPQAKQGRRSRRGTSELHAPSPQLRRIFLRTLQRVDFTNYLPCRAVRPAVGRSGWTATLTFFAGNALLLSALLRARREPREQSQWP